MRLISRLSLVTFQQKVCSNKRVFMCDMCERWCFVLWRPQQTGRGKFLGLQTHNDGIAGHQGRGVWADMVVGGGLSKHFVEKNLVNLKFFPVVCEICRHVNQIQTFSVLKGDSKSTKLQPSPLPPRKPAPALNYCSLQYNNFEKYFNIILFKLEGKHYVK